ncbi:TetR/AcrR family transcriptional regulator C-terminal ligand-binding domain-containing protein, partial [Streptomyces sp. KR55]|uniref:TetR/AcrR family transcriptional regulator C-terminal ligand-binding domain-containing protein n=1 Tax=Streptomyces sp. KR55 TaxID=3457425 RepID=UPI003FD68F31
MATTSPTATKPGRPRDPGADDRILQAVVDELAERGVVGFRINNVVARAKVAKQTIYARWRERDDLILAGLSAMSVHLSPPRTGSLVDDLRLLYDACAEVLDSPRALIVTRCSLELPDYPDLYAAFQRDCIDQPLAVVEDVLFEAQRRGELRADIDRSVVAEIFAFAVVGFSTPIAQLRGVTVHSAREQALSLFLD